MWKTACGDETCEKCGETLEAGEDSYVSGRLTYCGGCEEEIESDFGPGDVDQDEYDLIDGVGFADPGGNSALRAASSSNPRNLPCPTCERPNMLTPADVSYGYQCDACSDAYEQGYDACEQG